MIRISSVGDEVFWQRQCESFWLLKEGVCPALRVESVAPLVLLFILNKYFRKITRPLNQASPWVAHKRERAS